MSSHSRFCPKAFKGYISQEEDPLKGTFNHFSLKPVKNEKLGR
jgi:hypothetical protein